MTDKVNHLHQMVIGSLELWHHSTATLDTQNLQPLQEPARIQDNGITRIQYAIKVIRNCMAFFWNLKFCLYHIVIDLFHIYFMNFNCWMNVKISVRKQWAFMFHNLYYCKIRYKHISDSDPTTTTPPPPSKPCFPLNAKVKVENGKSVQMSELQIGDRVQTGMKQFC